MFTGGGKGESGQIVVIRERDANCGCLKSINNVFCGMEVTYL